MPPPPQNPRRVATIIWGALVGGTTTFLVVALSLPEPVRDPELVRVLLPVSAGMSIVTTMASWFWAVRMRPALPSGAATTPEALALARLIVASALCEGAALFALVVLVVTKETVALLPFAVSFVSLLAHFPRDGRWARLCGGTAPAGAGRNRMIRG